MPKNARFGRALVELNHQISNSRKRAARNHEESRVFTQPLRLADLCTLRSERRLGAHSAEDGVVKTETLNTRNCHSRAIESG